MTTLDLSTVRAELDACPLTDRAREAVDGLLAEVQRNRGTAPLVQFYPGDGSGAVEIEVAYIGDFPRDKRGYCAFCHADPCAEETDKTTLIAQYFARNAHAETCPMCQGRPS